MSHDADHRRLQGMLEQLAKASGKKWVDCEGPRCGSGGAGMVYQAYHDDSECETCSGAGKVLAELPL